MSERNWRDAKIPNWVSDSINEELQQSRKTIALSWPTEPRPQPAPFRWGEYDRLTGDPVPGVYWKASKRSRAYMIEIRPQDGKVGERWKSWIFREGDGNWRTSIPRGELFYSERDANLARLWDMCNAAADELMGARECVYA